MALKTTPFDAAKHLNSDEDIRMFLQAALEEGTEEEFIHAPELCRSRQGNVRDCPKIRC